MSRPILLLSFVFSTFLTLISCSAEPSASSSPEETAANRNLLRAIELVDAGVRNYFSGESMSMARYYNPYTESASGERGSVWMYTSSIEAVNAIMHTLVTQKNLDRKSVV
mgnify:FL=1